MDPCPTGVGAPQKRCKVRKLQKLQAKGSTVLNYATERRDVVDEKGLGELQSITDQLGKYESSLISLIDESTGAKTRHTLAYKRLRNAIHASRKALEMVQVRDGKGTRVIDGSLRKGAHMAKIADLAVGYQKALEAAGTDVVIESAKVKLKSAMDEYSSSAADLKAKRQALSGLRAEVRQVSDAMGVRLSGYTRFIASNQPRAERDDLARRIKAVTAGGSHAARQDATEATTVATAAPVAETTTTKTAA